MALAGTVALAPAAQPVMLRVDSRLHVCSSDESSPSAASAAPIDHHSQARRVVSEDVLDGGVGRRRSGGVSGAEERRGVHGLSL